MRKIRDNRCLELFFKGRVKRAFLGGYEPIFTIL
jgi:hypothetical protein